MARKPATPEQRREVRRRLRTAAAEIHAEDGVAAISARAVAARAGLSTGTLYAHYENLQDLMRSLWTEPVSRANVRLEEIAKRTPDPTRRIRKLLEAYARFAQENREVYRGVLLFVRPESHPKPERRPLREFVFFDLLRTALREGQAQGQVRRGNVDQLAQVLWASLHGAVALPINVDTGAFAPAETLVRLTIQSLLRSIEP
jgi:AcrR family transcriptional regulator